MNELDDLDQLERECGPALRVVLRRVAAEISVDASTWHPGATVRFVNGEHAALDEREAHMTSADGLRRERYPRRRWMLVAAAAIVVLALGLLAVAAVHDPDSVQTDTVPPTPAPSTNPATTSPSSTPPTAIDGGPTQIGGSPFAAAIEASGVLTSPSADEVEQATDSDLYTDDVGQTQVSAAGNYVSLRRCQPEAVSTCGTGWAYVTGTADGVEMKGGLLSDVNFLGLHLLDDRYFVASQTSPGVRAPSRAWLIDAVSGKVGALGWRDQPTTLNSPEQALLLCQDWYNTQCAEASVADIAPWNGSAGPTEAGLPSVVDARDGTIRPLVMPDDVVADVSVAQHGTGRIWVGTSPDGHDLGEADLDAIQVAAIAYSDDGGATWTEITIPPELLAAERLATKDSWGLSIAADGDRIAVTSAWSYNNPRYVYVSNDAGLSWSTVTVANRATNNGVHLYVLADGRLVFLWSSDVYPSQVLVSTGSEWTELENVDHHLFDLPTTRHRKFFSVNNAGIASNHTFVELTNTASNYSVFVLDTVDFSADLTNWSTIESRDEGTDN